MRRQPAATMAQDGAGHAVEPDGVVLVQDEVENPACPYQADVTEILGESPGTIKLNGMHRCQGEPVLEFDHLGSAVGRVLHQDASHLGHVATGIALDMVAFLQILDPLALPAGQARHALAAETTIDTQAFDVIQTARLLLAGASMCEGIPRDVLTAGTLPSELHGAGTLLLLACCRVVEGGECDALEICGKQIFGWLTAILLVGSIRLGDVTLLGLFARFVALLLLGPRHYAR